MLMKIVQESASVCVQILVLAYLEDGQWRSQKYFPGEQMAGVWGREPPVGSRGEAPVGGLGDEAPQKLITFF